MYQLQEALISRRTAPQATTDGRATSVSSSPAVLKLDPHSSTGLPAEQPLTLHNLGIQPRKL
jgi:hypothetical protein